MRHRFDVVRCLSLILTAVLFASTVSPAAAQSTAFTYQGSLDDAGVPANGLHDFRFRMFAVASGGTQIGSLLCVDNVSVTEGVFTVQLDFGQQYATTAQRHLEIDVRRDTGLTCANPAGFVLMFPRQQLTATPMASHANSAFALDAADGSPTNAVFVDGAGRVGIGTTSPNGPLHVTGSITWGGGASDHAYSDLDASGMFIEQNGSVPANSKIRLQTSKSGDATNYSQLFIDPNAGFAFTTLGTGNGDVGVGTTTPAAKLDVRGDIRLGSSGQYQATAGEENLRLLRGHIAGDGATIDGSGFTSTRLFTGWYRIDFSTPFAGVPTVTANAQHVGGDPARFVQIKSAATNRVEVIIEDDGGNQINSEWYFCVIGPR